jgi:hypothetical protein
MLAGCQHLKPLGRIACGWGYCLDCGSFLRTCDGESPQRDDQGRFIYAENGDQSASGQEPERCSHGYVEADCPDVGCPFTHQSPDIDQHGPCTVYGCQS